MKKPFGRVGGKSNLKKIILKMLPEGETYVEPFFGGGSIFFGLKKGDYSKEVINDLDKVVYDLMCGFARYDGNKISDAINGDYTKKDWDFIVDMKPKDSFGKFIKKLLIYKLSFYSRGKSFNYGRDGSGVHTLKTNYEEMKERLKDVKIFNKDYKSIIKEFDSPNTVFYLDPPYSNDSALYTHNSIDMEELRDILRNIKGKFVLSYANDAAVKKLFKEFKIKIVEVYYNAQHKYEKEIIVKNF
jgi:DNA adenine methylase